MHIILDRKLISFTVCVRSWILKDPSSLCTGSLNVGLLRQCQTLHGRDRTCIPPRLPREWITTLFFIILGIMSLTITCALLVMSYWYHEATRHARWIAFTGSRYSLPMFQRQTLFLHFIHSITSYQEVTDDFFPFEKKRKKKKAEV